MGERTEAVRHKHPRAMTFVTTSVSYPGISTPCPTAAATCQNFTCRPSSNTASIGLVKGLSLSLHSPPSIPPTPFRSPPPAQGVDFWKCTSADYTPIYIGNQHFSRCPQPQGKVQTPSAALNFTVPSAYLPSLPSAVATDKQDPGSGAIPATVSQHRGLCLGVTHITSQVPLARTHAFGHTKLQGRLELQSGCGRRRESQFC